MDSSTLPPALRHVVVYLDTVRTPSPAPDSAWHRRWLRAAQHACRRHAWGVTDHFLFVCAAESETGIMNETVQACGFPAAEVLPVGWEPVEIEQDFDGYCEAAGWIIEQWVRHGHPGALTHAGHDYDGTLFWWIGVEQHQDVIEWPFRVADFAAELPETHRSRAATWLAVLGQAVQLDAYQEQHPGWAGAQHAAVWAAALCVWLHGFEAASENDFNRFDPASVRRALRISDFYLGFEAARHSRLPLDQFAKVEDTDARDTGDAALRLITRRLRADLRRALSTFFGNDTGLFWALYSAIRPQFSRQDREACNALVVLDPRCIEAYPDIAPAWQFVTEGWCDEAES